MNQQVQTPEGSGFTVHHHKPRRLAQRIEQYIGGVIAVAALLLLGVLAYGLVNTGSGTPTWMH